MGVISRIAGPFVVAKQMFGSKMNELVRLGEVGVIGEIIRIEGDGAAIQAYEETTGLEPGEKVEGTGRPLSATLGPGLIGQIFDGIQRPLPAIEERTGSFVERGIITPALDATKKWFFNPSLKKGAEVRGGDIVGSVRESSAVEHKVMIPPGIEGVVLEIVDEGDYTITDIIAKVKTRGFGEKAIHLAQSWPVRSPRPYKLMMPPQRPQLSGQRVIDTFFPICKGGVVMIPGGFGTGKTVMTHTLARFLDADVVIYVGCGERGNEMADVIESFPKLEDRRTGKSIMERVILLANTSNMPIAAREASVYTGITMAEYYRDMGYDVALMADSTSRWAEALREISGRLEEMPGEEGYPAYLTTRLAEFYSRAGHVVTEGSEHREGSITVVGAVSPPGGDFSEPVTQNTLRIAKVFWSLDFTLAHRRHFPAINWLTSYSDYFEQVGSAHNEKIGLGWLAVSREAMNLLRQEEDVKEIASLLGSEVLGESQRLIVETARIIREDFLRQSAYHPVDMFCPLEKSYHMLRLILKFYRKTKLALEKGVPLDSILSLPVVEEISRMKFVPSEEFVKATDKIDNEIDGLIDPLITRAAAVVVE